MSKGISHPVFYSDLDYKLRGGGGQGTANFISLRSKLVKRLRRRQYDPLIIESTTGPVLGPIQLALSRSFLKYCTLILRNLTMLASTGSSI